MQNLTTLFGAAGAATFRQLLASGYRKPCWRLHALNEDGSLALDLTAYLKSGECTFTDDIAADTTGFVLANPNGQFDLYGGALPDVLALDRILQFWKGLENPATGQQFLVPAAWGRIASPQTEYAVKGEETVRVTIVDAFKRLPKNKINSPAYENTQANRIAADLLTRYGKFAPARIALAPLDARVPFAQFPHYPLIDALKALYEPVLFWVRADEAGRITTGPRLGSDLSGAALKGWPDQLTEPPAGLVAYTFPDHPGIETVREEAQDFDGIYNQVRVQGRNVAAQAALGPPDLLYVLQNSSISATARKTFRLAYSQDASTARNTVIARHVIVRILYSTNHQLDTNPREVLLSNMTWRGDWTAGTLYKQEDAVLFNGDPYVCTRGTSQDPTSAEYWAPIPFAGPFYTEKGLNNEDPRRIAYVRLQSVTSSYAQIKIEGRRYSVGNPYPRRYGGMDYKVELYGMPVLSHSRIVTAYADYNAQTVTQEPLQDIFGDHQTYQATHAPFAFSTPVEVFLDGESLGKIAADQSDLSGETRFNVDFERGRIVLQNLLYQSFTSDVGIAIGGSTQSSTRVFDVSRLTPAAPQALYQTRRQGDATFTFTGLDVGQGYDLRLHFADPTETEAGKRAFSIYAQGAKAIEGLDIVAKTGGAYIAYQETITGIAPDATGKIVLEVTQHDPASGNLLPECSKDGNGGGGAKGTAIISGIEILLPQGQGAAAYAVNAGGPALAPDVPTVSASYAFSPLQERYGAQVFTIDDPLLSSDADCKRLAAWYVNFSLWKRHRHTIRHASVPHLQPGDLVRYYHPRLNRDMWGYVQSISRTMEAGAGDADTYLLYLIYSRARS